MRVDVAVQSGGWLAVGKWIQGATCAQPCGMSAVVSPLQTSNPDVYAVGDVAAFPLKLTGAVTRQEHVTNCRSVSPPRHCLRLATTWGHASMAIPMFAERDRERGGERERGREKDSHLCFTCPLALCKYNGYVVTRTFNAAACGISSCTYRSTIQKYHTEVPFLAPPTHPPIRLLLSCTALPIIQTPPTSHLPLWAAAG